MYFRQFIRLCLVGTVVFSAAIFSQDAPIFSGKDIFHPVYGKRGMVASQEALATLAGAKVLQEGGNAVDAAVTVGFVLAVTLPRAGNIGGGGFMVVFDAKTKKAITIDYREKAPLKATADMFLDEKGDVDNEKARFSLLSAGVPGTVAGFSMALEKYGTYSLAKALAPAIHYAENGFAVSPGLSDSLKELKTRFAKCPASMKIFFNEGECYEPGEIIYQKDLAKSLKQIAEKGTKAFYEGEIAQKIASEMQKNGGLISLEDLKIYQPSMREPIHGSYRGYDVYSMPPPSSGGVHLVQMLNVLEHYPLGEWGQNSGQTIHVMAEAMKLAYADRAQHLGDPDFVKVPIAGITSKSYAKHLMSKINLEKATPSKEILADDPWKHESNDTTHFSVMDQYGNAVSNTYTLNFSYGSGFTVPGTGILLNNEMDDFVAKPGVPNAFGLLGGKANAIEPQKRMLSSMTPTIVVKDDKPFLVTGSPGGSRIITTTLQIILNVIDHDLNVAEASNMPRIHHQWYPDEIRIEKGLSIDTIRILQQKGHSVVEKSVMGSTQSIMWGQGFFFGASDPRRVDALTVGVKQFAEIIVVYTLYTLQCKFPYFELVITECNMSDPFLIFVTDPERKDAPISFGLTRIGRASASEIQINDANVSKAHCILIRTEQGVCVYDFSSRNGTFVGREKAGGQRLKDGDEIVLGEHWRLLYVEEQPALMQNAVAEKPTLPQEQKKLPFAHILPWIIAVLCGAVAFFPHSNENPRSKEISAIQQEVVLHKKQITQQEDTIVALQNKMQEQQQQVKEQQRTIERKKNLLALTQEQLRLVRKQRDRLREKWEHAKNNRENKDKIVDEKQAKRVEEKQVEVEAKEEEVVDKGETVVEVVEKKDRPQVKNKVQETSKSTYDLEALTKKLITVLESYAFPTISAQSLQPMLTQLSGSSSLEAAKKMLQLVDYCEELNSDLHKNITFLEKRVQQLLDLAKHKQNMSRDDLEKHQRLLELSQKKAEIQTRQQQRLIDLRKSIIEDFSKLQDVVVTEYLVTKINKRDEARSLAILNALAAAKAKHSIPKLIAMLPVKNTAIHDKVIATLSQITTLPFSTAKQWKNWWSKQDNK